MFTGAGQGGIPGDASGGDDVQPPQQCGCKCGPGLTTTQPVVFSSGQMSVARCHHRIVGQRGPYRAPGGQPQPRATAPRNAGPAAEGSAAVVARAQPGVFNHRAGAVETGEITG